MTKAPMDKYTQDVLKAAEECERTSEALYLLASTVRRGAPIDVFLDLTIEVSQHISNLKTSMARIDPLE